MVFASFKRNKQSKLLDAIRESNIDQLAKVLHKFSAVEILGSSYALHEAVKKENFGIIEFLLSAGFNVEGRSPVNEERTVLSKAVVGGRKDIVELLLFHGANPEAEFDGKTALQQAFEIGDKDLVGEIVQILLASGANTERPDSHGETVLQVAASRGQREIVHLLLASGACPNCVKGKSALYYASEAGYIEDVQLLLVSGAKAEDESLVTAAARGYPNIVGLLLANGANIEAMCVIKNRTYGIHELDIKGTALLHAIENGHVKVVGLLLESGADISSGGDFHRAILRNSVEMIQLLLSHGANPEADLNFPVVGRFTPLQYASVYRTVEVVELLITSGANKEAQGPGRLSPLHLAIKEDRKEVVAILLSHGANIEALDYDGSTPLLRAITGRNLVIVKLLLECGANPEAKISHRGTVLQLARSTEHAEIIIVLQDFIRSTKENKPQT